MDNDAERFAQTESAQLQPASQPDEDPPEAQKVSWVTIRKALEKIAADLGP